MERQNLVETKKKAPYLETRVYIVNLFEANQNGSDIDDWLNVIDEEFMKEAEKQGNVLSLSEFQNLCNSNWLNSESFIRIIDISVFNKQVATKLNPEFEGS